MLLSRGDSKVCRPSCQYSAVNETTWLPCFIISSLSSFSCVCCLLWSVQCVSSTSTGELSTLLYWLLWCIILTAIIPSELCWPSLDLLWQDSHYSSSSLAVVCTSPPLHSYQVHSPCTLGWWLWGRGLKNHTRYVYIHEGKSFGYHVIRYHQVAVFAVAASAIVGWPFSAALG